MNTILDLCSGSGSATAAFRRHGWRVITVDNNSRYKPDVWCDLRTWHYAGEKVDVVWSSPPCQDFSRYRSPWFKEDVPPSLALVEACVRLVDEAQPRIWWLENVQGAVEFISPILGPPLCSIGHFYLWSNSLLIPQAPAAMKRCDHHRSAATRATLPYFVSEAIYAATVAQL